MRAVEVSAVFEDTVHLRLADPVREVVGGPVKLIVLMPEPEDARDDKGLAWPSGSIDAAYGSCREDPLEEPPELFYGVAKSRDSEQTLMQVNGFAGQFSLVPKLRLGMPVVPKLCFGLTASGGTRRPENVRDQTEFSGVGAFPNGVWERGENCSMR